MQSMVDSLYAYYAVYDSSNAYYVIYSRQLKCLLCGKKFKCLLCYLWQIAQMIKMLFMVDSSNDFMLSMVDSSNVHYAIYGIDSSNVYHDIYGGQLTCLLLPTVDGLNGYFAVCCRQHICILCYLWQIAQMLNATQVHSSNAYNAIYGRQLKFLLCYLRQMFIMLSMADSSYVYYANGRQLKCLLCYLQQIAQMFLMLLRLISQMLMLSMVDSSNADMIAQMLIMQSTVENSNACYAIYVRQLKCLL